MVRHAFVRGIQLFVLLFLVFGLSAPHPVRAEDLCNCFCGAEGSGASSVGNKSVTDCETTCSDGGLKFISCASDPSGYPSEDIKCFTESQCEGQNGEYDTNYQPAECVAGQHYCYGKQDAPMTLSVALGDTKTVLNYGDYIQKAYTYVLDIAVTIAIVFVMIGGFQYVLAGASGDVEKAKQRIRNAVAGLVLLLCAVLILQTVNPRLIALQVPSFPKVRRVEIVSGDQSCEYLTGADMYRPPSTTVSPYYQDPYTLEGNPTSGQYGVEMCGSVDGVAEGPSGSAVPDGTTCQYESCPETDQKCAGTGDKAQCLKCVDAYPSNVSGLTIDNTLCSQLSQPETRDASGALVTSNTCYYTHDPAVLVSNLDMAAYLAAPITGGASLAALQTYTYLSDEEANNLYAGACASVDLDCSKIASCRDYESVSITTGVGGSNQLNDLLLSEGVTLQSTCESDPCGAAKKEGLTKCVYYDSYPTPIDLDGDNCIGQ